MPIAWARGGPEPEGAVDVHPGAALVGERDELGEWVEGAGVELSGLEDDDRRGVAIRVERLAQRVDAHAIGVVQRQRHEAVAADA